MNYIQRYKQEKRDIKIKQVIRVVFYTLATIGSLAVFYVLLVGVMLLTN